MREVQAIIQAIEEQLNQTEPTLIPSALQVVDQTSSLVASNHSGTSRSVAKGHHSLQSEVVSRRRQGYNGKKALFQPQAERVRPNDQNAAVIGEQSTQNPEIAVNTSGVCSPTNRNIIPTTNEHNVVTPDSNLKRYQLW
ncbi:hypothetical protein O181_023589 [Austropuccinia psidii MF-1]|uniref:Uncharacterized protein n=1 Tax=Austropuccinia psidii MF-1 TaxID=1389203 RepID=A0A9Q3CH00_9BASI|nr:hypothetical protein [Austropuccinia psidii MF-1]